MRVESFDCDETETVEVEIERHRKVCNSKPSLHLCFILTADLDQYLSKPQLQSLNPHRKYFEESSHLRDQASRC